MAVLFTVAGRHYNTLGEARARQAELDDAHDGRAFSDEARTEWNALGEAIEDATGEGLRRELRARREVLNGNRGGLGLDQLDRGAGDLGRRVLDAMLDVKKGEARALTVASTLAPGELSSFLWDKLRASSAGLASGMRVVTTERDTVTYPRLTADVAANWYDEAATITPGDPTLDSITATPRKLAHLTQFSNEVIDDSDPSAVEVVRDNHVAALGLKLDLGLFEGTGTAPQIRGLRNVSGIGTVSMGTNGLLPVNVDPWADAIATLAAANARASAIVMAPRSWASLVKIKEATGSVRPLLIDAAGSPTQGVRPSIYGVPVFLSSQLSITETQGTSVDCSTSYVYAADQCVLVRRQDVEVELDRSRLFNTDQSEMRSKTRVDLVVPNPTAVCRIIGIRAV